MMASQERLYHPKDAVTEGIKSTMITGGAGALVSAVQNTLTKQNVTAWGIFTRTGGTIAVFGVWSRTVWMEELLKLTLLAAMGGTYQFTKLASANLREKDDSWNTGIGGFLAGSVLGMRCSLPNVPLPDYALTRH